MAGLGKPLWIAAAYPVRFDDWLLAQIFLRAIKAFLLAIEMG
jgi:hypothetical protein